MNKANKTETLEEEIFVSLEDQRSFDWSAVVVEEPVTHSFTKGETTIEWTTSEVYLPGPNGEKLSIYFEMAPQNFWGISGNWPFGTAQEDRTLDTIDGFQICYPLTSLSTVDNPTEAEKTTKHFLDQTWNITVDAMKRFCSVKDKKKRKVPAPTYSAYATTRGDKDWAYAVKPVYDYSYSMDQKTNKKFVDKSKPQKTYIKFVTKGKGSNIRCDTKVFGPGDKLVSPYKYMSVRGNAHPVIHWDGIFWGSHGQKASYGASVRLRVSEMNFTPTVDSSVPRRRMLAINTAPVEMDVSNGEGEDTSLFE